MKTKLSLFFCVLLGFFTVAAKAEIQFSGYGSIVGGKVISGEEDPSGEIEFPVDFYDYAFYTEDFKLKPETMIALQARMDVTDGLVFTGQLVAKGADDFKPDIDWLYLTYNINDDWYVMAGRRNLPMYYFSEYMEVGYAYPWIRPPANLYWWEITQFNGLTVAHQMNWSDWTATVSMFAGREEREDIRSHDYWRNRGGYYFPPEGTYISGTADVTWSDILGVNLNASNDWIDLRFSYFTTQYETFADVFFRDEIDTDGDGIPDKVIERSRNEDGTPIRSGSWDVTKFDLEFLGLSGSFNFDFATLLFDYNLVKYDDAYSFEFPTYLITAIYNHDTWQPYIGYTKAAGKIKKDFDGFGTGDAEEHRMITVGIRYNFHPNASLKLQLDDFKDQGDRSPWYDFSYHNDAKLLSVGVDFVF
ncbi:hypothetical protein [Pseudoalteromonas xiamenensis]|uniref:Porin domain-containing protein n=1 Tax=Pseudoalteromonas xiamenensis TaxID=882626 RepID=A0A975DF97_9GAMM|nr:hypothetical protein [Pseudoalteromonas xiamenensis]QTH70667.1 hypothetical protein J5O05_12080 [Pseudoalteromonas xiamenensis]